QRSMHAHTSDIIVNLTLRIAKLCERIVYKEAETRYSIGLIYLPRIAGIVAPQLDHADLICPTSSIKIV
ncbi:MAG: hypothetical protein Q8R24_06795, partial [Legionellaceae bacterium]|nr:hypothetical protein [Legionellaceae bacterium]